jgi:peroxiredoxin
MRRKIMLKGTHQVLACLAVALLLAVVPLGHAASEQYQGKIYSAGELKPIDSVTKLKVGDRAPDFTLSTIDREKMTLSQFREQKNVVISFVPAAWTPVCSDQWPGYNIAKDQFEQNAAILLGITVDNIPTLFAWTQEMGGVWFPVLSDFHPHGAVAKKYGVLRSDGTSERALFIVDKKGIIRYIDVHDINQRPKLEVLLKELEKLKK